MNCRTSAPSRTHAEDLKAVQSTQSAAPRIGVRLKQWHSSVRREAIEDVQDITCMYNVHTYVMFLHTYMWVTLFCLSRLERVTMCHMHAG